MKVAKICLVSLIFLLVFAFVMAFVPTSSFGTAYADDVIDVVNLKVDEPVHGETTGEHNVTIADEDDRYFIRNYNWYDITADQDLMSSSAKFVGGHEYRLYVVVCVLPKLYPATQFAVSAMGNPDATVRVNGELADMKKHYGDDAKQCFTVVYEFSAIDEAPTDEIRLWLLDKPTSGSNPDYELTIGSDNCVFNTNMGLNDTGISWYAPHINSLVGPGNTFEKGRTYEFQCSLIVAEGLYFRNPLNVYIDGEQLDASEFSYTNQYLTITKQFVCEDKKIENVAINGITAPSWNSGSPTLPDYTGETGVNCHYTFVMDDDHADVNRSNGIVWTDLTSDAVLDPASSAFDANHTYKATIFLKADPYYEFAMNGGLSAVSATVNGAVAECHPVYGFGGDYARYLAVDYVFAPTGNTIQDIFVSNYIEPEHNKLRKLEVDKISTGSAYSVYSVNWYFGNEVVNDYFEFGKTYSGMLRINAEDGYKFDKDTYSLTINGNAIDPARFRSIEITDETFWCLVEFPCHESTINTVHVSVTEPVTGEHPSGLLVSEEPDKYSHVALRWYTDGEFDNLHKLDESDTFANNTIYGAELQIGAQEGYCFAESVKVVINGDNVVYVNSNSYPLVAQANFYSENRYTITFDANGGSGEVPATIENVKEGDLFVLPESNLTAPMEGKYFKGWSDSSSGEPVELNVNGQYEFNYGNDLILYAVWVEHNHTYGEWQKDDNGHWHECTDPECPDLEDSYFSEAHKYVNHVCSDCGFVEPTGTITFLANGGSGTQAPIVGLYDEDWAPFPECTFTAPDGKTFGYWEYTKDSNVYDYPGHSLQYFAEYGDLEFKAVWFESHTITYNMRGHGENIVVNTDGNYSYYDVTYPYYEGEWIDGNSYLLGFAPSQMTPAEYREYEAGLSWDDYFGMIDEDKTFYAVWKDYSDPAYGKFDIIDDKEIAKNGDVSELGTAEWSDFPMTSVYDKYYLYELSVTTNGLVNDDDQNDIVPISLYNCKETEYAFTIGGQDVMLYNINDSITSFATIAGEHDYIYIDGYGTEDDYNDFLAAGKIVIVNRGVNKFLEKAEIAASKNALGLIVVNSFDGVVYMGLDGFTSDMPVASVRREVGDLLKANGTKHTGTIDYYTGTLTVASEKVTAYYFDETSFIIYDLNDEETSTDLNLWYKINDPSLVKADANYTATISYKLSVYDSEDDKVVDNVTLGTTKLTIKGKADPVNPQPGPDPVNPQPGPDQPEIKPNNEKGGLSAGAIAGIVIASVAAAGGAGFGIFFLLKSKGIIGKGVASLGNASDVPTEGAPDEPAPPNEEPKPEDSAQPEEGPKEEEPKEEPAEEEKPADEE